MMEFGDDFAKQLTEIFKGELDEKTQILTENLLKLEKSDLPEDEKLKIIEEIFRASHNIKGASHGVGISDVGHIAHVMESIFSSIQKKDLTLSLQMVNLCFEAVDKMQLAMRAFLDKTPLPFDLNDLLQRLQSVISEKDTTPIIIKDAPSSPLSSIKKLEPPAKKTVETSSPAPTVIPEQTISPSETDNATIKEVDKTSAPVSASYQTIHVSLRHLDKVSALMEKMQISKIAIEEQKQEITNLSNKLNAFNTLWKRSSTTLKNLFAKSSSTSHLVDLSDFVTEISQLSQKFNKNLHEQINELSNVSNSLQEEIRLLRLIPANTLLRTMPRYVRDLSLELNKKIDLHIHGEEVKMDKVILEALQDPLTHLLRNAIDHGIEEATVRAAKEKPEAAQITISFREEGSHIQIKIEDDGAGIDINKIAETALNKAIITQAELDNMTEADILNLIFRPGFSTKTTVSNLSGRGIGLDVVKTNLEHLKGQVRVETEKDKGTTFILSVPLTLASERGLLIHCNGQAFMIPTHAIERVLIVKSDEIIEVETCQTILLNKQPLHLIYLADILQLSTSEPLSIKYFPIVIIKKNDLSIALVIDSIIGEREMVIKPLQPPLHNIPCITGGTLSGNGEVIMVLNTDEIVNQAFKVVGTSLIRPNIEITAEKIRPHILVVDDSITTRTLEKNVLESRNYQVTIAVDGKQAWDTLQKQDFALVITDINMPHMNGIELVQQIRKSDKLRELPIIMVTSLGSDEEKIRGMEAGADYYIVKSDFESGALLTIVEQLV